MRVTNSDCRTVAAREVDCAIKLATNIRFVLGIVEEHPALNDLHSGTVSGPHGLAIADGHAVEEVEIIAAEGLHHFLHAKQTGGHCTAHVVVQTHGVGHFIDRFANNPFDLIAAHVRA